MTEKLFQITRRVNLVVDEYDGEILTNNKVNIATLYRWRNTYTWQYSEKQVVVEETLRRAKFNSEYEDAKKRASEVKMKKKMTKLMKLQQMVRCNETNLQLYQRNRTNNQNRPKIICFACHKQSIQVGRSE